MESRALFTTGEIPTKALKYYFFPPRYSWSLATKYTQTKSHIVVNLSNGIDHASPIHSTCSVNVSLHHNWWKSPLHQTHDPSGAFSSAASSRLANSVVVFRDTTRSLLPSIQYTSCKFAFVYTSLFKSSGDDFVRFPNNIVVFEVVLGDLLDRSYRQIRAGTSLPAPL